MSGFSIEDLRLLAAAERQMDAGEVPWVRVEGASTRVMVSPELMELLDLRTGQTVSWTFYVEILRLSLEQCQKKVAEEVAANVDRLEGQMADEVDR